MINSQYNNTGTSNSGEYRVKKKRSFERDHFEDHMSDIWNGVMHLRGETQVCADYLELQCQAVVK